MTAGEPPAGPSSDATSSARYFLASGISIPEHSFRDTTLDEFLEVARLGFDDQNRIFEQLNHYMLDYPEVLQEKPYWAGIMLRDHRNEKVRKMLEFWLAHVQRYSRRDQLSVNVALRNTGLTPDCMNIDNHASWFHSWPHTEGRNRLKGARCPTTSHMPSIAYIRQLEQAVLDQARLHEQSLAEQERQHGLAMIEQKQALAKQEQTLLDQAHQHEQSLAEQERQHGLAMIEQKQALAKQEQTVLDQAHQHEQSLAEQERQHDLEMIEQKQALAKQEQVCV